MATLAGVLDCVSFAARIPLSVTTDERVMASPPPARMAAMPSVVVLNKRDVPQVRAEEQRLLNALQERAGHKRLLPISAVTRDIFRGELADGGIPLKGGRREARGQLDTFRVWPASQAAASHSPAGRQVQPASRPPSPVGELAAKFSRRAGRPVQPSS